MLASALALFAYSALDVSFSNWLPAFGKEILTESMRDTAADAMDAPAQRLISVYAVTIMIGRLLASQMPKLKEYGAWYVAAPAVVAAGLVMWMTVACRAAVAWSLVGLIGLFTAPFFPIIVATTFAKFSAEVQGTVFGIIFAGALLGGATVPKAIGNLARGSSIHKSMALLAPLCIVVAAVVLILEKL